MIRTRNFLLYVLSLVFLVSAIGYTVMNDTAAFSYQVPEQVAFVPNDAAAYGAIAEDQDENRDAYIEAMQQKIAQGLGVIDGAPIIFTSVDDIIADAGVSSHRGNAVLWCDVPARTDDVTAAWFQGPVALLDRGNVRAVVQTLPSADAGSSVSRDLILLPKQTARANADTCLPSDIIGIGIDGTLIANHETWRFGSYGSGMIIGYALDGFPIITGGDASQLDSCGGMDAGDGYAYRLQPGTEFILGCFAGTPAQFVR